MTTLISYLESSPCGDIRAECILVQQGQYVERDKTWYSRPHPVVVWLRKGKVRTALGTNPPTHVTRTAGDIVFFPPHFRHRLDAVLEPNGDYMAGFFSFEAMSGANFFSFFDIPRLISGEKPAAGEIREALSRLAALTTPVKSLPSRPRFSINTVVRHLEQKEMASRVLRAILSVSRLCSEKPVLAENSRVLPAIDYIRRNVRSPIRIETLANLTHLSRAQFHLCFRKATGRAPGEFIQHLRLLEVERLLLQTDLTVAEISERTGFSDSFHLSRIFQKKYGEAPSFYRKKHTCFR